MLSFLYVILFFVIQNQLLLLLITLTIAIVSGSIIYYTYAKVGNISMQAEKSYQLLLERAKQYENEIVLYDFMMKGKQMNVFVYDFTSKRIKASKGLQLLYGLTNNPTVTIVSEVLQERIDQQDLLPLMHHIERLGKGKTIKVEYRIWYNGQMHWHQLIAEPVYGSVDNKIIGTAGVIHDITIYKERQKQLKQLAFFDELTGLPNRNMMERELNKAIARSKRQQHQLIVTFIDLDGFKEVNDTLGHEAGDELLEAVANRLSNVVRDEDLVARLGGDEFIIVLEETEKEDIENIMERIIDQVSEPYLCLETHEVSVTPSIGLSVFPEDGEDLETLIKKADKAMYVAKENGKATHHFYDESFEQKEETIKNAIFNKIKQTFDRILS